MWDLISTLIRLVLANRYQQLVHRYGPARGRQQEHTVSSNDPNPDHPTSTTSSPVSSPPSYHSVSLPPNSATPSSSHQDSAPPTAPPPYSLLPTPTDPSLIQRPPASPWTHAPNAAQHLDSTQHIRGHPAISTNAVRRPTNTRTIRADAAEYIFFADDETLGPQFGVLVHPASGERHRSMHPEIVESSEEDDSADGDGVLDGAIYAEADEERWDDGDGAWDRDGDGLDRYEADGEGDKHGDRDGDRGKDRVGGVKRAERPR